MAHPPYHTDRPIRAICLDGGGYLGLATAAFLAELERHFDFRAADHFDLFCGTSTGGIIALALASGKSAAEVVTLYEELGRTVFPQRFGRFSRARRFLRRFCRAKWRNEPLKEALENAFGDQTLGDLTRRGRTVVVPALCLTNGKPRLFKTNHHPDKLTAHAGYFLRDVALATAAAPTYFPPVTLTNPGNSVKETFVDGGLFANNPALIAYTEARSYLEVEAKQIRILSVSPPRNTRVENVGSDWCSRGIWQWALPLAELFVQGSVDLPHFTVKCLFDACGSPDNYLRVEMPPRPKLGLDVVNESATQTLRQLGIDAATDNVRRQRLADLLQIGVRRNG